MAKNKNEKKAESKKLEFKTKKLSEVSPLALKSVVGGAGRLSRTTVCDD